MTEPDQVRTDDEGTPPSAPSRDLADLDIGPVLFVSGMFLILEIGCAVAAARISFQGTGSRPLSGALTIEAIAAAIEVGLVVALLAMERVHPAAAGLRFRNVPRGLLLGGVIWGLSQLALAIVALGRHGSMSLYVGWVEPAAMVAPLLARFLTDVFAEEIFWHGVFFIWILRSLEKRSWRDPLTRLGVALLASQFLFGVTRLPEHVLTSGSSGIPPGASLVLFTVTGMFYALIYLRTGNLWLVMIAHTLSLWPLPVFAFDVDPSKVTVLVSAILLIPTRASQLGKPGSATASRAVPGAGSRTSGAGKSTAGGAPSVGVSKME